MLIFRFSAFSLHSLAQVLILLFSAFFSWLSCSSYKIMLVFCFWSLSFLLSLCACLALFCLVPTCFLIASNLSWPTCLLFVSSLLAFLFLSLAYLSFICVLLLAFLFQMCFGGSSFWSHYPSNIYDTTCSFGHAHYPHDMYHTTKSLCFEGVLFRHMINMSSWLHYPSNSLPIHQFTLL